MSQACVYLPDPLMADLKKEAEEVGISFSRYVSSLLLARDQRSAWPEGYWDVYGSLAEDDMFQRPEQPDYTLDSSNLQW